MFHGDRIYEAGPGGTGGEREIVAVGDDQHLVVGNGGGRGLPDGGGGGGSEFHGESSGGIGIDRKDHLISCAVGEGNGFCQGVGSGCVGSGDGPGAVGDAGISRSAGFGEVAGSRAGSGRARNIDGAGDIGSRSGEVGRDDGIGGWSSVGIGRTGRGRGGYAAHRK